jgi:hypothetical protein
MKRMKDKLGRKVAELQGRRTKRDPSSPQKALALRMTARDKAAKKRAD